MIGPSPSTDEVRGYIRNPGVTTRNAVAADPPSLDRDTLATPGGNAPAAPGDNAPANPGGNALATPGNNAAAIPGDGASATPGGDYPATPGDDFRRS